MTRKDYELIADLLKVVVRPRIKDEDSYKSIVFIYSNTLADKNKKFDEERFRARCNK